MKRFLLLCGISIVGMTSCSKDDNPSDGIDRNCGVILEYQNRQDGGVVEYVVAPEYYGCTEKFREMAQKIRNGNPTTNWHVFYKGETRPASTYLVGTHKQTGKTTLFIRYESGKIPDSTMVSLAFQYALRTQTMTGLERFTY